MASRKLIIAILFLIGLTPLFSQNTDYYVELRFIQRLRWTVDEYAMRYEVIIEKEEAQTYRRFLQQFTEANFIEVSLPPGKYRYQVVPHDFLSQPIPVSEWVEFEVRPGDDQLTTGEHELIMINPGDETSRKEIILAAPETTATPDVQKITEYKNIFDMYIGAAWIPLLPVYSENQFIGGNLSLPGVVLRFNAVYARESFLNMGMELASSWRIYEGGNVKSTMFDLNALAQTRFPGGKTALNLRLGIGVSLLSDINSTAAGHYSFHINTGASFMWLFMKNFYMETGMDFSQSFSEDHFGFFRPWIGFGYKF